MAQAFTSDDERSRWYLRTIPVALLVAFYSLVAIAQIMKFDDEIRATINESDWAKHFLLAIHSLSVTIFFGCLAVVMFTRKEPIRREQRIIGWVLPFAVTISMSAVGVAGYKDFPTPVMLVATCWVVIGTIMTLYSLRFLGRHFGVVSDVRGLVTSGPYSYVRHPLYAGETVTSIGLVIAAASPVTITLFALSLALQYKRAKIEEQSITLAFPEYAEYAARTAMLIPFVMIPWKRVSGSDFAIRG